MNMKSTHNPKSKVIRVRVDGLKIHPIAQREMVTSNLKRLCATLDLDAIGVLHAVEYDKRGLLVIDGQHRLRALVEHGFGEWMVEVKVHLDIKDDEQACDKFLKLNKRAAVSPYDTFMNELHAGHEDACGADAIARRNHLKISRGAGDGNITCVTTLKKLYRVDGGKSLGATLNLVTQSWGSKACGLEGRIIDGIGIVMARYRDAIDAPSLAKKLAKYPGGPSGLIGDARGLTDYRKTTVGRCVAERVIDTYNSGRRGEGRLELL